MPAHPGHRVNTVVEQGSSGGKDSRVYSLTAEEFALIVEKTVSAELKNSQSNWKHRLDGIRYLFSSAVKGAKRIRQWTSAALSQ
jgi:hypothetical protein